MRIGLLAGVILLAFAGTGEAVQDAKTAAKDTAAADRTRTKLLAVKVTAEFKNTPLREVLKEFAAQVEMAADRPVMWTYAAEVAAGQPVSYSCKNKPLAAALDELFKPLGLGYVVVSKDDDRRDGWVRVTKGTERGYEKGGEAAPPANEDEKQAATRLAFAKDLIEKGKAEDAKLVLMLLAKKYPDTKAAAEAKQLLEKLAK